MTSDTRALVELKPCPFCGSSELIAHDAAGTKLKPSVMCTICAADCVGKTLEQAVERWNTRVNSSAKVGAGDHDGALKSIVERKGYCFECGHELHAPFCPVCNPELVAAPRPEAVAVLTKPEVREGIDGFGQITLRYHSAEERDRILAALSRPVAGATWTRETLGRAIYMGLYEHQGAVWEANDSKEVWYACADRVLSASPLPLVVGGDEKP